MKVFVNLAMTGIETIISCHLIMLFRDVLELKDGWERSTCRAIYKMNRLPLRFLNLLTNGILDNEQLLDWIDKVNIER